MIRYALASVLWLGSVCTCFADAPENYPFVPFDKAMQIAQEANKRIFMYFGRHGCGWCEKTNKEALSNERLRSLLIDNYVLTYVDAESGRRLTLPSGERLPEMELGSRLKVFATPVFVYMEPDGSVILKAPGVQTVEDFLEYDRFIRGGHYKKQTFAQFRSEQS